MILIGLTYLFKISNTHTHTHTHTHVYIYIYIYMKYFGFVIKKCTDIILWIKIHGFVDINVCSQASHM